MPDVVMSSDLSGAFIVDLHSSLPLEGGFALFEL